MEVSQGSLTDAVKEHQGTVDKFIGGTVMAFWNVPLETDHHSPFARNGALQMIEVRDAYNEGSLRWSNSSVP